VTTDQVALSAPVRLLRRKGRWALEVTRLVPVERNVLRPELRRITETDGVVRLLKERCAPALVREALDLIGGEDDGADCTFEVVDDQWVPSTRGRVESVAPVPRAEVEQLLSEMRAEMLVLRAMHESLRGRIGELERSASGMPDPTARSARRAARGSVRAPARRSSRPPPPPPPERESEPKAPEPVAPAPMPLGDASLATAPTEAVAPARRTAALPANDDVTRAIEEALGGDPELALSLDEPGHLEDYFVARMVVDGAGEVAAVLCDVRAGAELGGRLLGLGEAARNEQAASSVGDDVVAALGEISKVLGRRLADVNPGLRPRLRSFERYEAEPFGWLPKPGARLGFRTRGGGRLYLFAR